MGSNGNGTYNGEIEEEHPSGTDDHIVLHVNTHQRGLDKHVNGFVSSPTSAAGRLNGIKSESTDLARSPSKFQRLAKEMNGALESDPPTEQQRRKRLRVPFIQKINWPSLWEQGKEWIKSPVNMVLLIWILGVAVSGAILFMVMVGMLNLVLPKKSERDTWFEVSNQVLNALFTLMCLYQHPRRCHHLVLLCRWRTDDTTKLRQTFCKGGTSKPNEKKHMAVVIFLLQLNCFAQYALCGLNLGYPRSKRPAIGVGITISVAFSAPAVAAVYGILSPLGKDYETAADQEQGQSSSSTAEVEKKYSFMPRENGRVHQHSPRWIGGLFDLWDDISLAYLSIFCTCCLFGWNMSRLGFGNMYVHIVTFILFCLAPFFIFNLAAVNIDNETVREVLGISGILLCVFGLLYGGFWRTQMRQRFNLPGNDMFCGKPDAADCLQWLCCYSCSLAQEVRTADYYDIVEDKFYLKQTSNAPTRGASRQFAWGSRPRPSAYSLQGDMDDSTMENPRHPLRLSGVFASELPSSMDEEDPLGGANNVSTKPPVLSVIHKE